MAPVAVVAEAAEAAAEAAEAAEAEAEAEAEAAEATAMAVEMVLATREVRRRLSLLATTAIARDVEKSVALHGRGAGIAGPR